MTDSKISEVISSDESFYFSYYFLRRIYSTEISLTLALENERTNATNFAILHLHYMCLFYLKLIPFGKLPDIQKN